MNPHLQDGVSFYNVWPFPVRINQKYSVILQDMSVYPLPVIKNHTSGIWCISVTDDDDDDDAAKICACFFFFCLSPVIFYSLSLQTTHPCGALFQCPKYITMHLTKKNPVVLFKTWMQCLSCTLRSHRWKEERGKITVTVWESHINPLLYSDLSTIHHHGDTITLPHTLHI